MTTALLVFISCANPDEAERIGDTLLKKKLAACVQVVKTVDSMFLWPPGKNRIDYAEESLLLVKTTDEKWKELERSVTGVHSYDNPEIIAIPLVHVTKKYLAWMTDELS